MRVATIHPSPDNKLASLARLAQPVAELFYFGDLLPLLDKPLLAVVGSRKVSPYGRAVTAKLAGDLARAGVVIVSGLAMGVDSVAHQAALEAGGQTVAILPSGLDTIYPASHHNLARAIVAQGGALATEYPATGQGPMKHQFIARNRIIAALSRGVLITEAAAKSGSLHTAEFALEAGIEVFAVPGNITSATSAGTNNLIKSGASPVTSADDILEVLGLDQHKVTYHTTDKNEAFILKLLQAKAQTATELCGHTGLESTMLLQTLSMLEIKGIVRQNDANAWSLA